MGGACRSVLSGGGDVILAVPETEFSHPRLFSAPLVAAKFSFCAVRDANASLDGFVGTPLVAASFHPCTMRDANASSLGSVGAPVLAA